MIGFGVFLLLVSPTLAVATDPKKTAERQSQDRQSQDRKGQEQKWQRLQADATTLQTKVRFLTAEYARSEFSEGRPTVEERSSEGEILSLLGDYARAAIVLFDVVSNPENETHPQYDRALFFLAEAQFQTRNYFGARANFRRLIERRHSTDLFAAFGRLVEIADLLQDYSGVEAEVSEIRRSGAGVLRPDVAYHYGKSLARRGQSILAIEQLATIPKDHKYYFRSRYILGSEYVRLNRLAEALPYFIETAGAQQPLGPSGKPEEQANLRELGWLAAARVLSELQREDDSLNNYANIAQRSPYFEQMLYEVAAGFVRRSSRATTPEDSAAWLKRALRTLDLLVLTESDETLMPEARLLRGNILLRLSNIDDAAVAFAEVLARYEPTKAELDQVANAHADLTAYFNQQISRNLGVFNAAAFLPLAAVPFASGDRDLKVALGIATDLTSSHDNIGAGREIGKRLESFLQSPLVLSAFPRVQDGLLRAAELEATVLLTLQKAVVLGSESLLPLLASEPRKRLQTLVATLKPLGDAYAKAPPEIKQRLEQQNSTRQNLRQTRLKAIRVSYDIAGARARLVAARKLVDDGQKLGQASAAVAEQQRASVTNELNGLAALENEGRALELAIEEGENAFPAPGDTAGSREAQRGPYWAAMQEALREEATVAKDLGARAPKRFVELSTLAQVLLASAESLQEFNDKAQSAAGDKSLLLLEQVRAEAALLTTYEQELDECDRSSQGLVGNLAYRTFDAVRSKFYRLVLKARLGEIDTAWAAKEKESSAISQIAREQKDVTDAIENDFAEALQEDSGT